MKYRLEYSTTFEPLLVDAGDMTTSEVLAAAHREASRQARIVAIHLSTVDDEARVDSVIVDGEMYEAREGYELLRYQRAIEETDR